MQIAEDIAFFRHRLLSRCGSSMNMIDGIDSLMQKMIQNFCVSPLVGEKRSIRTIEITAKGYIEHIKRFQTRV
jgi:hypothetical protein